MNAKGDFRILGFVLGTLHDDGFDRAQIEWAVREILDRIEKIKSDPKLLEEFSAAMRKVVTA